MNLVPIDSFFPFRPRSVILSHRVISYPFDTFHSFLVLRIPFLLEYAPDLAPRSHSRPHPSREPRSGKPWDLRCRQRLSLLAHFLQRIKSLLHLTPCRTQPG